MPRTPGDSRPLGQGVPAKDVGGTRPRSLSLKARLLAAALVTRTPPQDQRLCQRLFPTEHSPPLRGDTQEPRDGLSAEPGVFLRVYHCHGIGLHRRELAALDPDDPSQERGDTERQRHEEERQQAHLA